MGRGTRRCARSTCRCSRCSSRSRPSTAPTSRQSGSSSAACRSPSASRTPSDRPLRCSGGSGWCSSSCRSPGPTRDSRGRRGRPTDSPNLRCRSCTGTSNRSRGTPGSPSRRSHGGSPRRAPAPPRGSGADPGPTSRRSRCSRRCVRPPTSRGPASRCNVIRTTPSPHRRPAPAARPNRSRRDRRRRRAGSGPHHPTRLPRPCSVVALLAASTGCRRGQPPPGPRRRSPMTARRL